jgi:hypothetical protein
MYIFLPGISISDQVLSFKGLKLEDDRILGDYGIKRESKCRWRQW